MAATRYALVTGASRGIGRSVALMLAEHGIHVAVHYHTRKDAAEEVLADIRACGAEGFTVAGDICVEADIRDMVECVGSHFGALDILVSNARPELNEFYQSPLGLTGSAWRSAIDSQASAFLTAVQTALPLMRDGGRIIAMTYSPSTRYGSWQPWTAMGAAKAALEALVRYFAVAVGPRGICVNAVRPGFVLGEPGTLDATVINGLPAEAQTAIRDWHEGGWTPMRRLASARDVAHAVGLLCSPEAGFITGQTLVVDGGASLMDAFCPLQIQGAA